VPIAFFLGAAIAASLLVGSGGHSATPHREADPLPAPVNPPAPAGSAQVTILLANEAREVQEQRLRRLHAKRLRLEGQLAAREARAHRPPARDAHRAAVQETGGTESGSAGVAPQSQQSERGSGEGRERAERQPKHAKHRQKSSRAQQRSEAKERHESERRTRREIREAEHEAHGHESHHAAG
jgi:hypothetical protein